MYRHFYKHGERTALIKLGLGPELLRSAGQGAAIGGGIGALGGALMPEAVRGDESRLEAALKGGLIGAGTGGAMGGLMRGMTAATSPKPLFPGGLGILNPAENIAATRAAEEAMLKAHLADIPRPILSPAAMGGLSAFAGQNPALKRDKEKKSTTR